MAKNSGECKLCGKLESRSMSNSFSIPEALQNFMRIGLKTLARNSGECKPCGKLDMFVLFLVYPDVNNFSVMLG